MQDRGPAQADGLRLSRSAEANRATFATAEKQDEYIKLQEKIAAAVDKLTANSVLNKGGAVQADFLYAPTGPRGWSVLGLKPGTGNPPPDADGAQREPQAPGGGGSMAFPSVSGSTGAGQRAGPDHPVPQVQVRLHLGLARLHVLRQVNLVDANDRRQVMPLGGDDARRW